MTLHINLKVWYLSMQNNILRMALGIYEREIVFFGGCVTYTGDVLKKGLFSSLQLAEVELKGIKCKALMERYHDGSAVIYDSQKGLLDNGLKDVDYSLLYKTFYSLAQNSAKYLSFFFFKRVKFFFLGLLQLCSIITMVLSFFHIVKTGVLSLILVILLLSAVILFFLMNKFYSYVRTEDIFTHSSILLTHKSDDETDDFWTDGN